MLIISLKRSCAVGAAILALMIITGCTSGKVLEDRDADVYRRIHEKFSRMTAYSATVRLTVKSNKTENTYVMRQQVKEPQMARVDIEEPAALQGLTTVYRDDRVMVRGFADEPPLSLPAAEQLNDIFVSHFFALYYQSEDTSVSVSAGGEPDSTLLLETAAIPESSGRYKITMRLDSAKLEPRVITVYDVGGNIRLTAEFSDFCYNPSLADSIFATEESERN